MRSLDELNKIISEQDYEYKRITNNSSYKKGIVNKDIRIMPWQRLVMLFDYLSEDVVVDVLICLSEVYTKYASENSLERFASIISDKSVTDARFKKLVNANPLILRLFINKNKDYYKKILDRILEVIEDEAVKSLVLEDPLIFESLLRNPAYNTFVSKALNIIGEDGLIEISNNSPKTIFRLMNAGKINDDTFGRIAKNNVVMLRFFIEKKRNCSKCFNLVVENIDDNILKDYIRKNKDLLLLFSRDNYTKHKKLLDSLVENIDEEMFDKLPSGVKCIDAVAKSVSRKTAMYKYDGYDSAGYDEKWLDKDGNLIQFFDLIGNYKISSKEDYMYIVKKFTESRMSVRNFCRYYGIEDEDGFKKLLARFKKEDEEVEIAINEHHKETKEAYCIGLQIIKELVANKEFSFDDYFKNSYSSYHEVLEFYKYASEEAKKKFAIDFVDFILENEFNLPIEKIRTLLCDNNKDISLPGAYLLGPTDKKKYHKATDILEKYNYYFCAKDALRTRYQFPNGITATVTQDVIDQALIYMAQNDIYRCNKTVNHYIEQILLGELDYSEESQAVKTDLQEVLIQLVKEKISIKEWFEAIEQYRDSQDGAGKSRGRRR